MGNIDTHLERKTRLEYVWLDGYNPTNLRSKVKVVDDYKVGSGCDQKT